MNEYQRLIAYLKILMCNLAVLHHNAVGDGWFEVHGELDRWPGAEDWHALWDEDGQTAR